MTVLVLALLLLLTFACDMTLPSLVLVLTVFFTWWFVAVVWSAWQLLYGSTYVWPCSVWFRCSPSYAAQCLVRCCVTMMQGTFLSLRPSPSIFAPRCSQTGWCAAVATISPLLLDPTCFDLSCRCAHSQHCVRRQRIRMPCRSFRVQRPAQFLWYFHWLGAVSGAEETWPSPFAASACCFRMLLPHVHPHATQSAPNKKIHSFV